MEDPRFPNPNHKFSGFDSGIQSIFTVFQLLNGDGWAAVMFEAMDSTNVLWMVFFIFLMLSGSFIMEQFISVVISKLVSVRIIHLDKEKSSDTHNRTVQRTTEQLSMVGEYIESIYDKLYAKYTPKPVKTLQKWVKVNWKDNPLQRQFVFVQFFIFSKKKN